MKKAILVATCIAALSTAGAFAQSSTGPAAQQDTMSKDKMGKEGIKKDGMGTTGMNNDGMKKGMTGSGANGAKATNPDPAPGTGGASGSR
jgi:pentapeptide MXKDX repeat protein